MKIKYLILIPSFTLQISGCDMFEYNPYDTQYFDDTDVNQLNIKKIELKSQSNDTLRFVFMGDTQRLYDQTIDFVNALNKRKDIDFVIHGGDITDFGLGKEYKWVYDIMKKLKVPFVTIIGNHDALGSGKTLYRKIYGDYNFSFVSHKTRFICLNTNGLEFDYSTPVPDCDYMMRFITDTTKINQTIVAMHSPPYDDQFSNKSGLLVFNHILGQYKNLQFCLHAHCHNLMVHDYFENGINYYGSDDMDGRNYLLFTVTPNSYSYSVVYF